jgi:hypothetical protein
MECSITANGRNYTPLTIARIKTVELHRGTKRERKQLVSTNTAMDV